LHSNYRRDGFDTNQSNFGALGDSTWRIGNGGWRFDFSKVLASDSQAFTVVASRQVGWAELPWRQMAAWAAVVGAVLAGLNGLQRQRVERRRAEELLRLGQVARLNSLGELSAGLAHELNQPLTAVLANTQAARRLLAQLLVCCIDPLNPPA
jgi:signal transduction histidine kinase